MIKKWLKYQKSNGYVVAIYESEIAPEVTEEFGVVERDDFVPGDELTYYIVVHMNSGGEPTGEIASVRQSPPAQYIMQQLTEKETRIADLEMAMAAVLGGV